MTAPVWPVGSNAYPQAPQQGYQQQGHQQQSYQQQGHQQQSQGPALPQQAYGPPNGYAPQNGYSPQPGYPTPAPRKARFRWVAVAVAVLVVAGIVVVGMVNGTTSGMDVERALHSALTDRASITTVSNVTCPDQLSTDKGSTVVCQASIDGQLSDLTLSFDADDHFVVTESVPAG